MARRVSRKRGRRGGGGKPPATPRHTGDTERTGGLQQAAPPGPSTASRGRESRQWFVPTGEELSRSQRRDAEARAALKPLAPGERPPVILVSALVAAGLALANLIAYIAGDKIGGSRPGASGIIVFSVVMLACAMGLWRMWYGAVLGFMALLAIIVTIFALLLIEASNVLGVVVALVIVIGGGYLFFKLVRVLSRIQMPRRPTA
ncbi:MAG TPA: hypothetical protein VG365_09325 [Solirubrobacteraceae bacterium]|nr:hypothetical protein [Solirubrobacteraceae bacterium]